ncbi:hypothetical protein AB6A40_005228 [Gnathostoma spinigerum]|uniref:Golgi apparatus membrane protein TVP23 homolog n=1 Tax=Gnathostoma spinigerum TaxID=75299 RepID=A0ABD6EK36_9BILA
MANSFDGSANFGEAFRSTESIGVSAIRHPSIVIAHVTFRAAAIFFYVFAYFFTNSFIVQFLVILFLLCADFWAVKNVTGRFLVGLRWWNIVDSEGNSHWRYESARETSRFDPFEKRIFWGALVVGPFMWAMLTVTAFVTLKWEWMVVAIIGLVMNGANLYGYLRCKWGSTQEFTNYLSKAAVWSFLTRSKPTETVPATPQQTV